MIVFDTSILLPLIKPETSTSVDYAPERINGLIGRLEKENTKIIIPTPSLSEVLIRSGKDGKNLLEIINNSASFKIVSFDTLAAIEVSEMTRKAIDSGDKKAGGSPVWDKVKYDRQIVAIAKVNRATAIYSDDVDISTFAKLVNIQVIKLSEIPIPNDAAQGSLDLPMGQGNSK